MPKGKLKLISILAIIFLPGWASTFLSPVAEGFSFLDGRAKAYSRAKEKMEPDLYLIYRIADRILTSNDIKRSVRFSVTPGISSSEACGPRSTIAGIPCHLADLLPDVDKATNFDIWAAQIVGTTTGLANASARSGAGFVTINKPMLKELVGKPDQIACVISHELAHVTQNHQEAEAKKRKEYDNTAAVKISNKVKRLRRNQNTSYAIAAALAGFSSGYSGDNTAVNNLNMTIAMNNFASQQAAPQIAAQAMQYSPQIGDAINTTKGLAPAYLKKAFRSIDHYVRDSSLSLSAFNRGQEYEADLIGIEYAIAAGFNPKECVKLWTETMPHGQDEIIARLLPENVPDPGKSETPFDFKIEEEKNDENNAVFCDPIYDECDEFKSSKKKNDSEDVPLDVMELLATHPSEEKRALALKNHLEDQDMILNLKEKGKKFMENQKIRDWFYDKKSKSIVISNVFKDPSKVGIDKRGTTGIDIDQVLGF